jgi:hypothetical protein
VSKKSPAHYKINCPTEHQVLCPAALNSDLFLKAKEAAFQGSLCMNTLT